MDTIISRKFEKDDDFILNILIDFIYYYIIITNGE